MRPHELDVDDPKVIVDMSYQSISVAADVEDDTVVGHEARMVVPALYSLWTSPVRGLRLGEPGFKRLLGIGMAFPKLSERASGDDPHCPRLACSRNGNNVAAIDLGLTERGPVGSGDL